jgi:hypothetical protein
MHGCSLIVLCVLPSHHIYPNRVGMYLSRISRGTAKSNLHQIRVRFSLAMPSRDWFHRIARLGPTKVMSEVGAFSELSFVIYARIPKSPDGYIRWSIAITECSHLINCYSLVFYYGFDLLFSNVLVSRLCANNRALVICMLADQASVLYLLTISPPFHMWLAYK